MQAPNGKPLPIPLALITISGTIPACSNPQKVSPVLPNPVWVSSATTRPPQSLTILTTLRIHSGGIILSPPAP